MSDPKSARLRAEVSYDLCVGVGMCIQFAPTAFRLNDTGLAVFHPDAVWTPEELQEAADACPMSAISIFEMAASGED